MKPSSVQRHQLWLQKTLSSKLSEDARSPQRNASSGICVVVLLATARSGGRILDNAILWFDHSYDKYKLNTAPLKTALYLAQSSPSFFLVSITAQVLSQNLRMAEVGRDLMRPPSPTPSQAGIPRAG